MSNLVGNIEKIDNFKKIKKRKVINCLPKYPEEGIVLYLDNENIENLYNRALAVSKYNEKKHDIYEKINHVSHATNLDHMALELSRIIQYPICIDEFIDKLSNVNNKSTEIYPGMPIKLLGNARRFINKNTLEVHYNGGSLNLSLKEPINLLSNKKFIYGRLIFIIGEVSSLQSRKKLNVLAILC